MSAVRLNAAAISAGFFPARVAVADPFEVLSGICERPLVVSRRDVVKAAGVAAVVATGAFSSSALRPITAPQVGAQARSAWLRAGWNRALLDPDVFGGRPSLKVSSNGDWRAALSGALFPGTTLPAGLDLLVVGSGALAKMRISHEFGGFETIVPLAEWLSGEVGATSRVHTAGLTAELGSGAVLSFADSAIATLRPDWSLTLEGPGVAVVTGLGERIVADSVTIALAGAGAPTLLSRRISRRAIITLASGGHEWMFQPPADSSKGAVTFDASTFDTLTLETAEARSGATYRAFLASTTNGGTATFTPKGRSAAAGATPLTLHDVRFGRLLGDGDAAHVAASFSADPSWVAAAGKAFLVGAAEWAPTFEFGNTTGKTRVVAQPAASAVVAPFEGGIAGPLTFADGTKVLFDLGDRMPAVAPIGADGFGIFDPVGQIIHYTPSMVPFPLPFATYLDVCRPADMLTLRFTFYNLSIVTDASGTFLKRSNPDQDSYIAVRFPSQHILEQAIKDNSTAIAAQLKPPLKSYLSEASRLVFLVSDSRADGGIAYTLEGLLDWTGFRHRVVDAASLEAGTQPHDIGASNMRKPLAGSIIGSVVPETSLAVPWGLWLSPHETEWWSHRDTTMTKNRRTELWHTRLHGPVRVGVSSADPAQDVGASIATGSFEYPPTVRAVWAEHYDLRLASDSVEATAPLAGMFRNSFTRGVLADSPIPADYGGFKNRWSVVDLSGRFHAEAIDVDNLMLTPLGAWLDTRGNWDLRHLKNDLGFPIMGDLIEWQHRATMGRDQYVKIVLLGRLFPFGHTAVEITVTERRVDSGTKQAFLGQKSFIVVLEPVRTYAQDSEPINRRHPFKRVEIKTKKSPQITAQKVVGTVDGDAYWVKTVTPSGYFRFKIEATDWDGAVHRFEMPLIWVRDTIATVGPTVPSISPSVTLGLCASEMPYQAAEMKGQSVAFADAAGGDDSNRVLPTNWIKFSGVVVSPSDYGEVRFYPTMWRANVRMDAIEEMTGQNAGVDIEIADIYRDHGYGGINSVGKVFAKIRTTGAVDFPAAMSGALATPIPMLTGISAIKGAFGGTPEDIGSGNFSPEQFFDSLNAKLIGGITLMEVLETVLDLDSMPVFEKVQDGENPNRVTVRYTWSTQVTKQYLIFQPLTTSTPTGTQKCPLTLTAEITKGLDAGAGDMTSVVRGTLGPFKLNLVEGVFDAIHLTFGTFTFESLNGASPTVSPDITNVEFGGDLKYLAKLAEYLGALTGSATSAALAERRALGGVNALETVVDAGPLKIDVTAQEIMASLTIAIPDLSIGVFSLTNMSFYAALHLPFTGAPVTLDFAFCSREAPFSIMVMGFGGGGYVMITFDAEGMRALEVSLEFGAGVSFGIGGIASGMVEIKGGLTLQYSRTGDAESLSFTVFIRIHGELDILGLISVTLTFYLSLTYHSWSKALPDDPGHKADELTGTATLTIEIEILCFSFPVELSVTKTMAGEDPRFGQLMPAQTDWNDYCAAFALAQLGA